ncbi:LysR family transcriptional regulator [Aeromicrobium sp. Leaf350]|uniref:LysR substrate-binding domain-containing protein n=1 Tax=Aeromicrobium sp. Leaf350 TaxID=2876565 RepID=UPI001E50C0AF|nr:LysR family transcriptional regulator [Aeromicrobium sp. Leaf350]
MDLELRHLRIVCAIAASGSITKAAGELGIAQPALTAQLRRIERLLGGPLFERDHRGVRPTALGDLVISRSALLLPAVSGLLDDAARLTETSRSALPDQVSLGSSTTSILAPLIRRLTETQPELTVSTTASWSADDLATELAAGRLDFCIAGVCGGSGPPAGDDLEWRTFSVDPVFVLLPEDHALARQTEVTLADLSDAEWAATPGDGCFETCFHQACLRAGFTPRSLYVADAASCIELVTSGTAVALCQATRTLPGLVTLPLKDVPLRWIHMVGWRPGSAAAGLAPAVHRSVELAHADLVARSEVYSGWLDDHPEFGVAS